MLTLYHCSKHFASIKSLVLRGTSSQEGKCLPYIKQGGGLNDLNFMPKVTQPISESTLEKLEEKSEDEGN